MIADEPTTALDVTTQKQILKLIDNLRRASGAGEEITAIADRCVALDPDKSTAPTAGRKPAYDDAFALYRRRLAEVHGVH